jgi:hypothetical protein
MKFLVQRAGLLPLIVIGVVTAADGARATDQTPVFVQAATIRTGTNTTLKGVAIQIGDNREAAVCFDTELLRMSAMWEGGFISPLKLMSRGEYPESLGEIRIATANRPGWSGTNFLADPRPEPFGPLPAERAKFQGVYRFENRAVLSYTVGSAPVLEMPWYESLDKYFTRSFHIGPSTESLMLMVCQLPPKRGGRDIVENVGNGSHGYVFLSGVPEAIAVGILDAPKAAKWEIHEGHLYLNLPPLTKAETFQLQIWRGATDDVSLDRFVESFHTHPPFLNPANFIRGGDLQWTNAVLADFKFGQGEGAYVVDNLGIPFENPYGSKMHLTGLDFFSDGRAAVSTFHGDVWFISGMNNDFDKIIWERHASGLFHALGLKIVDDEVFVTGRDQITRLRDLNKDGEADFYENFNNDCQITTNFHEFAMDLQTDAEGNFYFAKAGPVKNGGRGFQHIVKHHGALFKVSKDGKKFETIATGFRAPNGIGVGPNGELTSGDNEGTWTPRCRLNWIKPGGFYGVVDLAHRDPAPTDYDRPLCWLPKEVDNSSGGQVWVADDRWGPFKGRLLHLSYGTCSLFSVLKEDGAGPVQGGVTRFPLNFSSGTMRARFHPGDGQLYVLGMKGWQTSGVLDGSLQRVRYTGAPARMPHALRATKRGVEITFTDPLDRELATDPGNFAVSQWNYIWSSAYGSPEISAKAKATIKPGEDGAEWTGDQKDQHEHDTLTVKSATLSDDGKTVTLELPEIQPVMQMKIKFNLETADGKPLRSEIFNTIHALNP